MPRESETTGLSDGRKRWLVGNAIADENATNPGCANGRKLPRAADSFRPDTRKQFQRRRRRRRANRRFQPCRFPRGAATAGPPLKHEARARCTCPFNGVPP